MKFSDLAFKYLCGDLQAADCVRWAEDLLAEGSSSMAVAELASYSWDSDLDRKEVERAFQLCIAELGLQMPTEEDWYQTLMDFTSSICQTMVDGMCEAEDGLARLLNISEDHHDPYVMTIWLDLVRDLDETGPETDHPSFNLPLRSESRESCIIKTAEQYIALCATTLPERFPRVWWCRKCGHVSEASTWTTQQSATCPNCREESALANVRHYEHRDRIAKMPNPSIERTSPGKPGAAAHVKR